MSFIEIKNLTHVYNAGAENEHEALKNININIDEGEMVAVLGSNGSGKSTLAKHLNGLLLPTSGSVLINGLSTSSAEELWQIRQQVGMVFQNPDNQLIAAIVEDDVAFGPENLGLEPAIIRERVKNALAAVDMSHFRTFAPHLLSGGQKQRVAIAGALAIEPKCLILDEATAMLDPVGRGEVWQAVKKLHDELGMTIIFITHFMEEAALADRVIVMNKGELAMDGTPQEIFTRSEEIKSMGLDVPLAVEIAASLRQAGVNLPLDILTDEELVQALGAIVCR